MDWRERIVIDPDILVGKPVVAGTRLAFEFTRTIATGDYVVVHWTVTGTHNGPLATPTGDSIPATGKKLVLKGSSTFELRDGKLTREWGFFDNASIMAQLGLMPG